MQDALVFLLQKWKIWWVQTPKILYICLIWYLLFVLEAWCCTLIYTDHTEPGHWFVFQDSKGSFHFFQLFAFSATTIVAALSFGSESTQTTDFQASLDFYVSSQISDEVKSSIEEVFGIDYGSAIQKDKDSPKKI